MAFVLIGGVGGCARRVSIRTRAARCGSAERL